MDAVVLHPRTHVQSNLLQQLAKAMSIPFSILSVNETEKDSTFLAEIQTAGKQAQKIATGKEKGQTLDDLLNELD